MFVDAKSLFRVNRVERAGCAKGGYLQTLTLTLRRTCRARCTCLWTVDLGHPKCAAESSPRGPPCGRPDGIPSALSDGRLKAAPGGGPVLRCLEKTPGGGRNGPPHRGCDSANPLPGPQRRTDA